MSSASERFYQQIPGFPVFDDFSKSASYRPLPDDWLVVITDIQGSTEAIREGRYKDVNAMGVASIVAVLNGVDPVEVPYVFGGDGATLCVPGSKKLSVQRSLVATRIMAREKFDLEMRIGIVPVNVVRRAGSDVLVGKYQPSSHYRQAVFWGGGIGHAETLIKEPGAENPFLVATNEIEPQGSFEGFQCRWREIPSLRGETITLLVRVLDNDGPPQNDAYVEIVHKIKDIYGSEKRCHPIQFEQLSLASPLDDLSTEVRIRTAFQPVWNRWTYAIKLRLVLLLGKWLMQKNIQTEKVDWGRYKHSLIANTDYRKFDESLRMTISGTSEQQSQLRHFLEKLRKQGRIVYGIHASPNALMTCVISNYDRDHVHFLDGSSGGYALAAEEMKRQLKQR